MTSYLVVEVIKVASNKNVDVSHDLQHVQALQKSSKVKSSKLLQLSNFRKYQFKLLQYMSPVSQISYIRVTVNWPQISQQNDSIHSIIFNSRLHFLWVVVQDW